MQDILSEIQRLKEEANRFVAILAKEEEEADENLSPARRQTLTREVESLQVTAFIEAPPTRENNKPALALPIFQISQTATLTSKVTGIAQERESCDFVN